MYEFLATLQKKIKTQFMEKIDSIFVFGEKTMQTGKHLDFERAYNKI